MQRLTRLIIAPLALALTVGAAGLLGGCDDRPNPQADDLQPTQPSPQQPTQPPTQQPAEQPTMPHQETDPERDTSF